MTWHGQINRTIWEIGETIRKNPREFRHRRELLRTHFLQRYELDRSQHIPRDDRSFLFLQEERAVGVLLLHGAHGTPAEMRDYGNFLYGKGFTVYCPRLSRYDLKNRLVTWESWVTTAENALTTMQQYTRKTIISGLSMGATVALVLDQLHSVKGLILLAPALYPRLGFRGRLRAAARHISPTLFYKFAGWDGELVKAMDHVRKTKEAVRAPALIMQAKDDQTVSARGFKTLQKRAKDPSEAVMLASGSHALTRGAARQEVFDRAHKFGQIIQRARDGGPPRGRGDGGSSRSPQRGRGDNSPSRSPQRGRGDSNPPRGPQRGRGDRSSPRGPQRSRGDDSPPRDPRRETKRG